MKPLTEEEIAPGVSYATNLLDRHIEYADHMCRRLPHSLEWTSRAIALREFKRTLSGDIRQKAG
jgi:hypothetical protein